MVWTKKSEYLEHTTTASIEKSLIPELGFVGLVGFGIVGLETTG
jgi:hypothetical protein